MIILMKCLDEERAVKRVLSDFHDESWVEKVIVIDGGSTDFTVHELKQFDKVRVFVHPWFDWYHDMEILQSNIALSYIPHGRMAFILDFDEKMSPELKNILETLNRQGMPDLTVGLFSRKTYEVLRYDGSPVAVLGEDGWPIISHQIGQYPDFQMRLLKKDPKMHWVNSPHHVLFGYNNTVSFEADIIHYEKDDYRDRVRIEKKWAKMQARRKMLGLVPDVFDTTPKREIAEFYFPEQWKDWRD